MLKSHVKVLHMKQEQRDTSDELTVDLGKFVPRISQDILALLQSTNTPSAKIIFTKQIPESKQSTIG